MAHTRDLAKGRRGSFLEERGLWDWWRLQREERDGILGEKIRVGKSWELGMSIMYVCVCVFVEEDQGEGEIWCLEEYQIQFFHSCGKETEAGGG